MRLLLIALLALPLTAQQATLTMTGPATVRPGATINANLSLSVRGATWRACNGRCRFLWVNRHGQRGCGVRRCTAIQRHPFV